MKGDEFSGIVITDKSRPGCNFSITEKQLLTENIKRILRTRKGERVNNPEFGSYLLDFLFLPQVYVTDLLEIIKKDIEQWEPRVKVVECSITSISQDEVIEISLKLNIISKNQLVDIEVAI